MPNWKTYNQDILNWVKEYRGKRFHCLISDPPYNLNFMGRSWDKDSVAFKPETWYAIKEHLHDGAFGFAFSSSRTYHRLAVAIEDAGFILHSNIFGYGFGSGFPKATRIDKQVDEMQGIKVKRGKALPAFAPTKVGYRQEEFANNGHELHKDEYEPQTDLSKAWHNHRYGKQALKPAIEPILLFQKPYLGKPVQCIIKTGAGALNIGDTRIGVDKLPAQKKGNQKEIFDGLNEGYTTPEPFGRWPSNLILIHHPECRFIGITKTNPYGRESGYSYPNRDYASNGVITFRGGEHTFNVRGSEEVEQWECVENCAVANISKQSGYSSGGQAPKNRTAGWYSGAMTVENRGDKDYGTASRYFYNADWSLDIQERLDLADQIFYTSKVDPSERDAGLGDMPDRLLRRLNAHGGLNDEPRWAPKISKNNHVSLKPIKLIRYLASLLLPPDIHSPRRILVPFSGSGSEMIGALLAGFEEIVGVEKDTEEGYYEIAEKRLEYWARYREVRGGNGDLKPDSKVTQTTIFDFAFDRNEAIDRNVTLQRIEPYVAKETEKQNEPAGLTETNDKSESNTEIVTISQNESDTCREPTNANESNIEIATSLLIESKLEKETLEGNESSYDSVTNDLNEQSIEQLYANTSVYVESHTNKTSGLDYILNNLSKEAKTEDNTKKEYKQASLFDISE